MSATASSLEQLRTCVWNRVEEFIRSNYENPDIGAVKVLFACVAAHRIADYAPVWTLAEAPSGSMKTEILRALDGLPSVYFVDEVTESTFISGKLNESGKGKRSTPASFLHRMGCSINCAILRAEGTNEKLRSLRSELNLNPEQSWEKGGSTSHPRRHLSSGLPLL
jgi:hypothetical protein